MTHLPTTRRAALLMLADDIALGELAPESPEATAHAVDYAAVIRRAAEAYPADLEPDPESLRLRETVLLAAALSLAGTTSGLPTDERLIVLAERLLPWLRDGSR